MNFKRLDCCAVLLALTSAAAALLCTLEVVDDLLVGAVGDMALLLFLGCMSKAAFCAAAKSSECNA